MITIISGTNRPGSRSLEVSKIVLSCFQKHNVPAQILDIQSIPFKELDGAQYSEKKPGRLLEAIEMLHQSSGYYFVCPEYNGSMPGALKYFIDHWEYPRTFENIPVAFLGLGGRFGGVRPIEHLQQVLNYRNAFVFPERIFLFNVWTILKEGKLQDEATLKLLEKQTLDFSRFISALEKANLHGKHRK
jgi:chromate reductase, NAD(P)H dehydrogenase (quinone)